MKGADCNRRRSTAALPILIPDRIEDVGGFEGLVEGDDFVGDVAGDEENVSGSERLLFAANREGCPAFENDADLLVWVGMHIDDGVRLQACHRDHELFGRAGLDAHAWEDRVVAAFIGRREIATHCSLTLRW
jgi:hypothetical protein